MLGNMFDTSDIRILERVVSFTETRQEVLANNIANIDTPDYKVKDLDVSTFQEHLRAIREGKSPSEAGLDQEGVDYRQHLLFHDRNNRSIEKQMSEMMKNTLWHNVATELLQSRYKLLERAICLVYVCEADHRARAAADTRYSKSLHHLGTALV